MLLRHRVTPQTKVDLASVPTTCGENTCEKETTKEEFKRTRKEISKLQEKLYANQQQALLVVFQAMDAGGKDGTTKKVFKHVNPQGIQVASFKAPSATERAHDYLWRIHQAVPARGMMRVFNRSHYEDVVVVRVDQLVEPSRWQQRFEQINQFEKYLTENRIQVVKFFLHISQSEQKQRFQKRLDNPEKHWKFSRDDLRKRSQWDDYMAAYSEALTRCSTEFAPWYVIPADERWYRNWAVAKIIAQTLRDMDPQFPPLAKEDIGLKIE